MRRLTFVPQPGTGFDVSEAPAAVEVVGLQRLAFGGRWRVEAMRSYSRPALLWFTRGAGRITVNGVTRGYGAHNAIFLPPGTMHGFDMLGQVLGSVVFLPAAAGIEWPEDPLHLRVRDVRLQAQLTGIIEVMERASKADDAETARELYHHAGLLGVWLRRRVVSGDTAIDGERVETAASRLVAAYTALVERDYRQSLGVADYARTLGVTPTHLSRACRATSGRTAHAILADRRLYEARRLLRDTRIPVSEIAVGLGFGSPAYFSRAFRSETGLSPSDFRRAPITAKAG